jgi:RNA polymerase sigma-70 factor (ECF subfamily)
MTPSHRSHRPELHLSLIDKRERRRNPSHALRIFFRIHLRFIGRAIARWPLFPRKWRVSVSFQQPLSPTGDVSAFGGTDYRAQPPPSAADPDDQLIELAGRGDVDAFGKLVDRHSGRLYRIAFRLLCDAQEAEDAVQDCFTRLWQNAPLWEQRGGGLLTWLQRVTVNLCLDRLRRFRVIADGEVPEIEDDAPGPERQLAIRRLERLIEEALGALPHRHRAALVLCYLEGLSNLLAAEMLGLNLKAMESLLFRARRSLREQLERMDVAAEDLELLA